MLDGTQYDFQPSLNGRDELKKIDENEVHSLVSFAFRILDKVRL